MMIKDTKARAGEHLISEVDRHMSRTKATLLLGQLYPAGAVLGRVTATKKLTWYDPAASDGSQTVFGVLFDEVDATTADKPGVINRSLSCMLKSKLTFKAGLTDPQKQAAVDGLEAKHIYMATESGLA
jgi:hypothetical protein